MDKVWGNNWETHCAWCLTKRATKEYVGLMAGEELVRYQVCDKCYKDSPNYVSEVTNNGQVLPMLENLYLPTM